jgi:hypothetical protein
MLLRILINNYASVAFEVFVPGEWKQKKEVSAMIKIRDDLNARLVEKGASFSLESINSRPRFGRISEVTRTGKDLVVKLAF